MASTPEFLMVAERDWAGQAGGACLLRHTATGLNLLVVHNADPHRMFGLCVRTPPVDGRGGSHALEHLVLAGSERFTGADPFGELLRGSLVTYSNAFTRPDHTCFVAASHHPADIAHFAQVYLDGAFRPLLRQASFEEHVGRCCPDGAGQPRFVPGVMSNEVRAVYANPETVLSECLRATLFPDHYYRHPAGGAPGKVPELRLADVRDYHARYYRPANSLAFCYGALALLRGDLRGRCLLPDDRGASGAALGMSP